MGVQILQGSNALQNVTLNFNLGKPLPPLQHLIHSLIRTQLEQNVHILSVFEEVFKAHYIVVVK